MKPEQTLPVRTLSPGEIIFTEGFEGIPVMYVIKEGRVEISIARDEKRLVLTTLGKGQSFGEMSLIAGGARSATAKAITYCELQIVSSDALNKILDKTPPVVRHMLRALIARVKNKDGLVAKHAHEHSEILVYAQILELMATPMVASNMMRRTRESECWLPLHEAKEKLRRITGHTEQHVMATLKFMSKLLLVQFESGNPVYEKIRLANKTVSIESNKAVPQYLRYESVEIVKKAQHMSNSNQVELGSYVQSELEVIDIAEIESLVGVDRKLILKKLIHEEMAEDLFAFRKSIVLNFISEKGVKFFTKAEVVNLDQMDSLDDIGDVESRVLFEAVNSLDIYDLAKLINSPLQNNVKEKLITVLSKSKQAEIDEIVLATSPSSAVELQRISSRLIDNIKRASKGEDASKGKGVSAAVSALAPD